ncbi:MAG: hypothetical protein KAI66_00115, partial [Lentisphaeria bacterium]|nr:hypothetical protein [Lentisphaeria bacterium]
FKDAAGDANSAGAKFFENIVRYALAETPALAAERPPSVLPEGFRLSLSDLMGLPGMRSGADLSGTDWAFTSNGPYSMKTDRRGVLTFTHGDQPSAKGSFAQLTGTLKVPPGSRGFSLRWYESDTYCGGRERILGGVDHGKTAMVNRKKDLRFAQILVNDQVVWEEDVLGRNPQPARNRIRTIDITKNVLGANRTCRIALRVEDREGSGENPFAIDVFWGALELLGALRHCPASEALEGAATARQAGGSLVLSAGQRVSYTHHGVGGSFLLACRVRDDVNTRPKLTVSLGAEELCKWQLTADDSTAYWACTPPVKLRTETKVFWKLTGDREDSCAILEFALIPVSLLADKPQDPAAEKMSASPPAKNLLDFELIVAETRDVGRRGEVATQGVPFGQGVVKDPEHIHLADSAGRPVPCQARVIARWPDRSIRSAVLSFPVTIPARKTAVFKVQINPARRALKPPVSLQITGMEDALVIDTGVIRATISKTHGRIVEQVMRGERRLKAAADVWALEIEDENGRVVSTAGRTVTSTRIVERGPLHALVVRKGSFADSAGKRIDYRLQIEAWAGSDALGLEAIIINREDTSEVYVRRWSMDLAGALNGFATVDLDLRRRRRANPGAVLYQHREDKLSWTGDEEPVDWGKIAAPGVVRIPAAAVGVRWFWQRFPQAVRFSVNKTRFDFIPAALDKRDLPTRWQKRMAEMTDKYTIGGVGYPQSPGKMGLFRLTQGEALHQQIRFVFDGAPADAPARKAMAPLTHPLRAVPAPAYTAATRAFGQFHPSDGLFPRYDTAVGALYDMYMEKRRRRREYGFENFGDDTFEWGYGPSYTYWSNSEYDHHHGFALQYLRSADPRWWEICEQQARMYRDVVVNHHGPIRQLGGPRHHNATSVWMPSHEEQCWVADHCRGGTSAGHSWVQGMVDYW